MRTLWLGGVNHQPLVSCNFTVGDDLPAGEDTVICSIVGAGAYRQRKHPSSQHQDHTLRLRSSPGGSPSPVQVPCVPLVRQEGKVKAKPTSADFSQGPNTRHCHSARPQRSREPTARRQVPTHPVLPSKENGGGTHHTGPLCCCQTCGRAAGWRKTDRCRRSGHPARGCPP